MYKDYSKESIDSFMYEIEDYINKHGNKRFAFESFQQYSKTIKNNTDDINRNVDNIIRSEFKVLFKQLLELIETAIMSKEEYLNKYFRNNSNLYIKFRSNIDGIKELKKIYSRHGKYLKSRDKSYDFETFDLYYWHKLITKIEYFILQLNLILTENYPEFTIGSIESFKIIMNNLKTVDEHWWFRGQSNEKWKLLPSYLRNINRQETKVIDISALYNLYNDIGLIEKYYKIFDRHKKTIDYHFLSYMQHSVGFSPFLDFTSDFLIATSFALSNKSRINDFLNTDSAIFLVNPLTNSTIEKNIKGCKVALFKTSGNISIRDYLTVYKSMGRIFNKSADVHISSNTSNDRMKYQKGKFLMYNDFFMYDENSVPNDKSSRIIKIIIDRSIKEMLLEFIRENYPYYTYYYLMNPYSYFST